MTTRREHTGRAPGALLAVLVLVLALAGCAGGGSDGRGADPAASAPTLPAPAPPGPAGADVRAPELVPESGSCRAGGGFTCSRLRVPLDRAGSTKGRVTLRVAVQDGARPAKGYLVVLTGGPGQPGVPYAARARARLGPIAPGYGLVLLDQRGTGRGALDCPQLQRSVGFSDIAVPARGSVEECARKLGPRRGSFTTADTVADLEDLRQALGAERLTLAGISYGTFVAERYALAFPARVRGLVLDSVVRQQGADALQVATMAAVPRVLQAVCAKARCRTDVRGDLRAALAFGADDVGLLDTLIARSIGPPRLAVMPAALHEAARGRLEQLDRLTAQTLDDEADVPAQAFSAGLHAATLCAESDVPWPGVATVPADREQALAQARGKLTPGRLGGFEPATAVENGFADTCRRWTPLPEGPPAPTGALPAVPTLLLAGELDLSTPMEDAAKELRKAPSGRLVVVPGAGHSLLFRDTSGCALQVTQRFLAGRAPGGCAR